MNGWVEMIGLARSVYSTHFIRRIKASLIHKCRENLRAVQPLLAHTKLGSTVRYLGVAVDDALEMAEHADI